MSEQAACTVIPSPPHIVGELFQLVQLCGNTALDDDGLPLCLVGITCFNLHVLIILIKW